MALLALLLAACTSSEPTPSVTLSTTATAPAAASDWPQPSGSSIPYDGADWDDPDSFRIAFEAYGFVFDEDLNGPDVLFATSADELAAVEILGSEDVERVAVYDATVGGKGIDKIGFLMGLVLAESPQLEAAADWVLGAMDALGRGEQGQQATFDGVTFTLTTIPAGPLRLSAEPAE